MKSNKDVDPKEVELFKLSIIKQMRKPGSHFNYLLSNCPQEIRYRTPRKDKNWIVCNNHAPMNLTYYASEYNLKLTFQWDDSIVYPEHCDGRHPQDYPNYPRGGHSILFEEIDSDDIPEGAFDFSRKDSIERMRFVRERLEFRNNSLYIIVNEFSLSVNPGHTLVIHKIFKTLCPYKFSFDTFQWDTSKQDDDEKWEVFVNSISEQINRTIFLDYIPHFKEWNALKDDMIAAGINMKDIKVLGDAYFPKERKCERHTTLWLMKNRIEKAFASKHKKAI